MPFAADGPHWRVTPTPAFVRVKNSSEVRNPPPARQLPAYQREERRRESRIRGFFTAFAGQFTPRPTPGTAHGRMRMIIPRFRQVHRPRADLNLVDLAAEMLSSYA